MKIALRIGSIAAFFLSIYIYRFLFPFHKIEGGIAPYQFSRLLPGNLALLLLFALYYFFYKNTFTFPNPAINRMILYAGGFQCITTLNGILYSWAKLPEYYYFLKYNIPPVIMSTFAASLALAFGIASFIDTGSTLYRSTPDRTKRYAIKNGFPHLKKMQTILFPLLFFLFPIALFEYGVSKIEKAFSLHRIPYEEVTTPDKPGKFIDALRDPVAWKFIEKKLQTNRPFRGFLTYSWPRYKFMNIAFGIRVTRPDFLNPAINPDLQGCIFWNSGVLSLREYEKSDREFNGNLLLAIKKLENDSRKKCSVYIPRYTNLIYPKMQRYLSAPYAINEYLSRQHLIHS